MRFKQWVEVQQMGIQGPTTGNYVGTALKGVGKAVAGALPLVGTAVDIGSTVKQLWQMRKQGQNVTPLILKMMHQQDQAGAPANAFDLEDGIAAMLSDPSKIEIAKSIVAKIDTLLAQAQAGKIPPDAANIEAVNYIRKTIGPTYDRLRSDPNVPKR